MTPEQLDALIDFIEEAARYEAARVTDDEASGKNRYAAERTLRAAFASDRGTAE